MIVGLDLGSRLTKLVTVQGGEIKRFELYDTVVFYTKLTSHQNGELLLDLEALDLSELTRAVVTGYGSSYLRVKGAKKITEIKAHVKGAVFATGLTDFTLLDIGGQDSKVISVKGGTIVEFVTNDRCAACSGRFLENMAKLLHLEVEESGNFFKEPAKLSSTCAVFSETELIAQLAEGKSLEELAAGVNYALFKRIEPLLLKFPSEKVVFTGGVGNNRAIQHYIALELGKKVVTLEYPEFAGALGCCLTETEIKREELKKLEERRALVGGA